MDLRIAPDDIEKAVEEISELINLAPLGLASWKQILEAISQHFPDSFSSLQTFDLINNSLRFLEVVGLNDIAVTSHEEHYSTNPYEHYWRAHKSSEVWISDPVLPITVLGSNGFHNARAANAGDSCAAIGVKLEAAEENEIRVDFHFPMRLFELYAQPAKQLITRLCDPLCRAIELSRQLASRHISIATTAALLDRKEKAACVLEGTRVSRGANQKFERLLRENELFQCVQGRIETVNPQHLAPFSDLVDRVASSARSRSSRIILRDEEDDWIVSCAHLPTLIDRGPVVHQPLVLVLVTRIGKMNNDFDLSDFGHAYHLTKAEEALCQVLASGKKLTDAAAVCGISYETARSRIKVIFHKTHMTKQSDLLLLLEQFRTS